jgi:hypothetical protein
VDGDKSITAESVREMLSLSVDGSAIPSCLFGFDVSSGIRDALCASGLESRSG